MVRDNLYFIGLIGALVTIASCVTYPASSTSKIASLRTIILNETDTIMETDFGGINTWKCKDFVNGGSTLVELGNFKSPDMEGIGFVLYDGKNRGDETVYRREGLNHRWDWGLDKSDNSYNYSFVIKSDGTGLFYNFSKSSSGNTVKADDVFMCRQ